MPGDSDLTSDNTAAAPTRAMETGESGHARIDRYRLLQKIGEGGMGEVWLAEQKEPVRRRVALKLVRAGMNSRDVIARFESERQALALMDHPGIAKVLDAGTTSQGAPYFVMEYVSGTPITEYCDNHRLSTRDRLELFIRVCEGVQHAHQKAIIHRDLKPSNILVAEVDGRPAPKIIDFGVAKALTHKLTAETMFTRFGALVGTPAYMSPEQALSSGEDIDTRTDVYSLGVTLYELLAGTPPLDVRQVAFDEFLRKLREEEPPRPSTRIRTQDHATWTDVARKRQTEPAALARYIRGDLDSIALKALEKDRARRYGSPSDLAADIRRYLNQEPVQAVPPAVGYRARKFARRHRVGLATAAGFVLVLIAASVISIRQSLRADRETAVAQAVNDFLQSDVLAQASAFTQSAGGVRPDPDLKVRTALDRAAIRIQGKFDRQPEVEAAIRTTIGETYRGLGLYSEARQQLERALEVGRRALGPRNPKTIEIMRRLGWVANNQGRYPEAESLFRQAMETSRRVLGPESRETLADMHGLANTYHGENKLAEEESIYARAVEVSRRVLGPEDRDTLAYVNGLGSAYYAEGKYPQAEAVWEQSLAMRRRVSGPDHPDTLVSILNLASVYYSEGKIPQAEVLETQLLETSTRVLGPQHPNTLMAGRNLAGTYYKQGKFAQAEALYRRVLEAQRRVLGPEHSSVLNTALNLAISYIAQGKYAEAEALNAQSLDTARRVLGPEHRFTLVITAVQGESLFYQKKYPQAERLLLQALETEKRVLGAEHPYTLDTLASLTTMYEQEGKYNSAETYGAQALAGRRHALGPDNPDTMISASDLALAYISAGKFAEAEPLAREAVETDRRLRPDDWERYRAESLLGAALLGQKRFAEAGRLLTEGVEGMQARSQQMQVSDSDSLKRARAWLAAGQKR